MQLRLLRHATSVLWVNGVRVLIDPMLSRAGAMDPVPDAADGRRIPLVELTLDDEALGKLIDRLDGVLVTHLHRDHFDSRAAELLPKTLPIFCQPVDADRLAQLGFRAVMPIEAEHEWRGIRFARTGGRHGRAPPRAGSFRQRAPPGFRGSSSGSWRPGRSRTRGCTTPPRAPP